jgi:hypothetical protein
MSPSGLPAFMQRGVQRQVRAGATIVDETALQQTTKMPSIQKHHMIQTFSANRTD